MNHKLNILAIDNEKASFKHLLPSSEFMYSIEIVTHKTEARLAYQKRRPHVLFFSIDIQWFNPNHTLQYIRHEDQEVVIIAYSIRKEESNKIMILNAGADLFINQSENSEIFSSYLQRIYQRIIIKSRFPHVYQLSSQTVYDSRTRLLTSGEQSTKLPRQEGIFLHVLCSQNTVVKREDLIHAAWGSANINKISEVAKYISLTRNFLQIDPSLHIKSQDGGYILFCTEKNVDINNVSSV